MENKYKKLVDVSNQFNKAVLNFGETLQLVKAYNEKYKSLYANENHTPRNQIKEWIRVPSGFFFMKFQ